MSSIIAFSWEDVFARLDALGIDTYNQVVYGVPKGGMLLTAFLRQASVTHNPRMATVILDDIIDSGATAARYHREFPTTPFVSLLDRSKDNLGSAWVRFPWEAETPSSDPDSVQDNIARILRFVGEDPSREGLLDTPNRVVKAWREMAAGYHQDPADLMTVFEKGTYDQIVLLRDIELFSMCEHHMLPFFGRAHVAYLPRDKVVGISKIARLVDLYARRLQIQERIGEQVTHALMEHLDALGAACVIEAEHLCMRMRGVGKQNSVMLTSSMKGAFLDNAATRAEFLGLLRT